MAKGIGLIGNFRGKVGNMVGYNLKDSNNKQTQGVRVYQPIVKNPKTYGQAEQRAKLAPINATYRALKMIIDRGQEGKAYGNKSRLAWLSAAMKYGTIAWFNKGIPVISPVGCQLTKGSLQGISYIIDSSSIEITCDGVTSETAVNTVGAISTALKAAYPSIKDGDQITFVVCGEDEGSLVANFFSIVIDTTDNTAIAGFSADDDIIKFTDGSYRTAGAVIISREGSNGEHLRSNAQLALDTTEASRAPYDTNSKEAAIKSYMTGGSNTDWAEESLQG